jgi:High potential iron-sulfur protein
MQENQTPRRQFLKIGGAALALIPVMIISGRAEGATNGALRTSLKYQGKPEGEKSCGTCVQFVPGANAKALGGCKIMPGDTEISPQGYCTAWVKKA